MSSDVMKNAQTASPVRRESASHLIIGACTGAIVQGFILQFILMYPLSRNEMTFQMYALCEGLSLVSLVYRTYKRFSNVHARHAPHSWQRQIQYSVTTYVFGRILYCCVSHILGVDGGEWRQLGFALWVVSQVVYHTSEFLFVCIFHPLELEWKSFLINHSIAYTAAFFFALSEYFSEYYLFTNAATGGTWKTNIYLILIGLIVSTVGQFFRIASFFTAKSNFHHLIQYQKKEQHRLVTHGVYAFARHPSYLGFYLQSLGGQMMLANPVTFLAYAAFLWYFFQRRIRIEEAFLISFFGLEYENYRQKTPVLIPFMDWYLNKPQKDKSI